MDTAVALVQAYLQINGYFTVSEYPVLEAYRGRPARTITDLDILAFRFAGAGYEVVRGNESYPLGDQIFEPDPAPGCRPDRPDMIVGEVKEGAARLNPAMRDPVVLEVALARFGCCSREHAAHLTKELLSRGRVDTPAGHAVRMVAFGTAPEHDTLRQATVVPMPHVIEFLRTYLRQHWDVLRHSQVKDSTLGILVLLQKWGIQTPLVQSN